MATNESSLANDLAQKRTDLAVDRTVMAANRTLMAWVRTSASLTSFGFTIYKFLQQAQTTSHNATMVLMREQGPRRLGLFLIALGTASAVLGTIEYYHTISDLNKTSIKKYKSWTFSTIVGSLIGLLGLFLFLTIFLNREVF